MAHYLVRATPKEDRLPDLRVQLDQRAFEGMRPFGRALTRSLEGARREEDETAVWEEEDYCSPPLAQEREAVLDDYFESIEVEQVEQGEGWRRIESLPSLYDGE
ncbi:MAG TPA: hypothetical protein VKA88_06885 [Solirubrobacterales bacterium]|nr:hypothetical protein [Solirubrobacterales bacterium]